MNDPLSVKQEKAISLLAGGKNQKDVAAEVGVAPETICAWKRSPEFFTALNRLRADAREQAEDILRSAVTAAAETLVALVKSATSEETRRKAAVDVLAIVAPHPEYIGVTSAEEARVDLEKKQLDAQYQKQVEERQAQDRQYRENVARMLSAQNEEVSKMMGLALERMKKTKQAGSK